MSRGRAVDSHRRLLALWPRLFGYALSLAQVRDQAEDLLQEAAVRALAAAAVPRDERAFAVWCFTILRHAWIDRLRRQRIVVFEPLPEEPTGDEAAQPLEYPFAAERLQDKLALREALGRLPSHHREVLLLVDLAGFSYREVSDVLGVPLGTVMSRVSRARRQLLAVLAGEYTRVAAQ